MANKPKRLQYTTTMGTISFPIELDDFVDFVERVKADAELDQYNFAGFRIVLKNGKYAEFEGYVWETDEAYNERIKPEEVRKAEALAARVNYIREEARRIGYDIVKHENT